MDEKRVREIVREELRRFLDDVLAASRAGAVEATTACDPRKDVGLKRNTRAYDPDLDGCFNLDV